MSDTTGRTPEDRPEDRATADATPTSPYQPGYTAPPAQPNAEHGGRLTEPTPVAVAEAPRDEQRRRGILIPVVVAVVVSALLGGGIGAGVALAFVPRSTTVQTASGSGSGIVINNPSQATVVAAVAAKAAPSVVTVSVSSSSAAGNGSGIVLSSDGYVLTNNHVATLEGQASNPTISVTMSDGRIYKASLVGSDPLNDLAVLKLRDASGLVPATFGDSAKLNVGDQVVAIGAPLDLPNTVTSGIISALGRSIQVASSAAPKSGEDNGGDQSNGPFNFWNNGGSSQTPTSSIYLSVLQTDAAINPGNSGGPLFDAEGRVIGVNVAIAGTGSNSSGEQSGNIGVGFSIPSDIAKRIADDLIAGKKASHGQLGVESASQGGATTGSVAGVEVSKVVAGGPAADAGLKVGDVITAVDGVKVSSFADLAAQVRAHAGGASVEVDYVRGGRSLTVPVTLGTLTAS